jgi:hypothetical protein
MQVIIARQIIRPASSFFVDITGLPSHFKFLKHIAFIALQKCGLVVFLTIQLCGSFSMKSHFGNRITWPSGHLTIYAIKKNPTFKKSF